ncbi:MAG: hypothetical protein H7318_19460 [Oligoflexus sp.]|nr:hypothetical protein [Oligoflexus sp.]
MDDYRNLNARTLIYRYRKQIMIAGIALATIVILGVVGLGFAVYKTASFTADKVQTWEQGLSKTGDQLTIPKDNQGLIEGFVLNVASEWLQQGLASKEAERVKNGLFCFDAIGGPSPIEIVSHVKKMVTDPHLSTKLEELNSSLSKEPSTATGPTSCANWFLSS